MKNPKLEMPFKINMKKGVIDFGKDGHITFQHGTIPEKGINGATITEVCEALMNYIVSLNSAHNSRFNYASVNDLNHIIGNEYMRFMDRSARHVEGKLKD